MVGFYGLRNRVEGGFVSGGNLRGEELAAMVDDNMIIRIRLGVMIGVLFCAMSMGTAVAVGEEEGFQVMVGRGLEAMNGGQWQEALAVHTQVVERFGSGQAVKSLGPKFGVVIYRKGMCEMKLKRWREAMDSFELCYRDYPDTGGVDGNQYHKLAVKRWGEAAMGAGEWELAVSLFKKFINERNKVRDRDDEGLLQVNLAICHYKLGQIAEGNLVLETVIRNKQGYHVADADVLAGFQAMAEVAIRMKNEQAVIDFLGKNRKGLVFSAVAMDRCSGVLVRLAGESLEAGMEKAAMAIFQLVPSTGVGGDLSDSVVKLEVMAYLHERQGNLAAALEMYRHLEVDHHDAPRREEHLFQLVRLSQQVGSVGDARHWADVFGIDYPDSPRLSMMRSMLLAGLFKSGEYAVCIEMAEKMMGELASAAKERDICLYVLGGSYFLTGKHAMAQPWLDRHVAEYPGSLFASSAAYFQASNLCRLGDWMRAEVLLEKFVANQADVAGDEFLARAMYDLGNCREALGKPSEALADLSVMIGRFPHLAWMEDALMSKGRLQRVTGEMAGAAETYQHAVDVALMHGNGGVVATAMCESILLDFDRVMDQGRSQRCILSVSHSSVRLRNSP